MIVREGSAESRQRLGSPDTKESRGAARDLAVEECHESGGEMDSAPCSQTLPLPPELLTEWMVPRRTDPI